MMFAWLAGLSPPARRSRPTVAGRCIAWLLLVASATAFAQGGASAPGAFPQSKSSEVSAGPLDSIRNWLSGSAAQPALLPPDQAFQLSVRARDANTLVAELTPARNYYLYREKITFSVADPPSITIADLSLPKGEPKADPTFGTVEVFYRPIEAVIKLNRTVVVDKTIQLLASFQGCNDPLGVCYAPIERTIAVALVDGPSPGLTPRVPGAESARTAADDPKDGGQFRRLFAGGSLWTVLVAFFGFGLLLAFTPCMLPMIPILSGIVAGSGKHLTRRHAFGLSGAYVLGMAIAYALAGVVAGLAGTMLSAYLQNPWVLGGFAAIFVLLALSMFGLYELRLPAALQNRLVAAGSRIKGGRAAGIFLMGVLSAVIVSPCVVAPLAGALLYIGQTRDIVLGGSALFSMAIGMGLPLLVVGATAGAILPKAGPWTRSVQQFFGLIMLAMAVYIVSPVVPVAMQQALWAALLIVPAIYLRAIDTLPTDAPAHMRLFKSAGVILLVTGIAILVGLLAGHRSVLQPLAVFRGAASAAQTELAYLPVNTLAELDSRLQASRGRAVMLEFWAEWCVSCKEMDRITLGDPQVRARLKDTVLLRADVTTNVDDHRQLLQRFSLFGPPGFVFFDQGGNELPLRVIGYQSPDEFLASMDSLGWRKP